MKKKIIITILIILFVFIGIKFIPFGIKNQEMSNSNKILRVPKLSTLKEECCMFSATFKSYTSKLILQKELDNIMESYEKKHCNSKIYYYDKTNDITITEYGVKTGIIFNEFYITYDKGNICE